MQELKYSFGPIHVLVCQQILVLCLCMSSNSAYVSSVMLYFVPFLCLITSKLTPNYSRPIQSKSGLWIPSVTFNESRQLKTFSRNKWNGLYCKNDTPIPPYRSTNFKRYFESLNPAGTQDRFQPCLMHHLLDFVKKCIACYISKLLSLGVMEITLHIYYLVSNFDQFLVAGSFYECF